MTNPTSANPARYAPVAVFAFRRPDHLRRTLAALEASSEFRASPLFLFCDGARGANDEAAVSEVRSIARSYDHPRKVLVEAPQNRGLAASIVAGVSRVFKEFETIIVVEDDLIVAAHFLDFMNRSLDRFRDKPRVMQVSGHMFPVDLGLEEESLLLPFTTTWGWGTWRRAWPDSLRAPNEAMRYLVDYGWRMKFDLDGAYPYARMLVDDLKGRKDTWGIWWYFHVFQKGGLALYPRETLVRNEGFDGSGEHCPDMVVPSAPLGSRTTLNFPRISEPSPVGFAKVRAHIRANRGFPRRVKDTWMRMFPQLPANL